ncbi:unnamed protein product [Lymnaea stagnalis]|uniref:Reelin domain-containing protein n=1 Tax=Lymnaea stagnalis TaxID=6523 RepID=A0AAV2HMP1_LYMST
MLRANISAIGLVLAVTLASVNGFPQGGPNYSCKSLTPGHANGSQVDTPPYGISVTRDILVPGGTTSVILESLDDFPFLGFICAVSDASDASNNTIGRFSYSPSSAFSTGDTVQLLTCARSEPDTGVTHVSRSDKYRVAFDWTAPPDANAGQRYKLRCSFVQSFYRCWTNVQVNISVGGHQQSTTESTFGSEVNGIGVGNIPTNNSATGGSISSLNGAQPFSATSVAPASSNERNLTDFSTPQNGAVNNLTREPPVNNQDNVNIINSTSPASDISVSSGPSRTESVTPSSAPVRQTLPQRPEANGPTLSSNSTTNDLGTGTSTDPSSTGRRVSNTPAVSNTSNAGLQTGERFTNPTQANLPNNADSTRNVLVSDNGENARAFTRPSSSGANTSALSNNSGSPNLPSNSNTGGGSSRNTTARLRGEVDAIQQGPNVASPSIGLTTLSTHDVAMDNSSSPSNIPTTASSPPRINTTRRRGNVVPNFILQNPNAFFLRSWNIRNALGASRNSK